MDDYNLFTMEEYFRLEVFYWKSLDHSVRWLMEAEAAKTTRDMYPEYRHVLFNA